MTPFDQTARITVTPLTPIHIGCGETFEPTNYVIDGNDLFAFDPSLVKLTESQRLQLLQIATNKEEIANGNLLLDIQNFFKSNAETFIACAKQIIPVSNEISQEYYEKVGRPTQGIRNGNNIINRLSIDRTTYHPHTGTPYLPGSSLKGAIRTAILDRLNNGRKPNVPSRMASQWENKLLRIDRNKFEQSAFRLLKVTDLMADDPAHQIVKARQYRKRVAPGKRQNSRTIPARKQVITPGQYRIFSGQIQLQILAGINANREMVPPKIIKNLKSIASDVNKYYRHHMERDLAILERFRGARIVSEQWLKSFIKLLDGLRGKLDSGEVFLVKLGQYGGAESKTYTGNVASIKIMHGRDKKPTFESTTTTMWLCDCDHENVPFGWSLIEIDPQEDLSVLKNWCEHQTEVINRKEI